MDGWRTKQHNLSRLLDVPSCFCLPGTLDIKVTSFRSLEILMYFSAGNCGDPTTRWLLEMFAKLSDVVHFKDKFHIYGLTTKSVKKINRKL